jgi:hypothetical protein
MIGPADLEVYRARNRRRELERREAAARRVTPTSKSYRHDRDAVDMWFHLWSIPATAWLRWLSELHRQARR